MLNDMNALLREEAERRGVPLIDWDMVFRGAHEDSDRLERDNPHPREHSNAGWTTLILNVFDDLILHPEGP